MWAWRTTGQVAYRDVALRHALRVAKLLVRPDGSTVQSVHTRRSDGKLLFTHTHQGYSDESTWARGQAWALYGFARTAAALRDSPLLDVAVRTAQYVRRRLASGAVPPYDFDDPTGAPLDTSAGVIASAGLFELADACSDAGAACAAEAGGWRSFARGMLRASLAYVDTGPPDIGLLGSQVFAKGGSAKWDDDAELIFGDYYALDAIRRDLRAR